MKWRNQLLALVCLLIFAAGGVLYFRTWVVQKPFAIIVFVGEGLTAQRIATARVYNGGADSWLTMDTFPFTARVRNYSADFAVPDPGAAASAIATGTKVKNGAISINESGDAVRTILEMAHEKGRSTGIVTDGTLTNPTLAAFYAHSSASKRLEELAKSLTDHDTVDLAFGGGASDFDPVINSIRGRVLRNLAELQGINGWPRTRVFGLFAKNDLPFADEIAARSDLPSLADMVRRAIELLQLNRRGYVLLVNGHLMGSAAWQNLGERTLRETIEFDRALQAAHEYAGGNAAIIVSGDVSIGGMNINGYPFRYDSGAAILGLNASGQPWITWATGPNGGRFSAMLDHESSRDLLITEPAVIQAPSALNSIDDPIAHATGLGVEQIRGTIDNTTMFSVLQNLL